MEEIFTRRSVRAYKPAPVEPDKIEKLLRAAMQAPSAGNQQPWEFLVVQKREALDELADMGPYSGMLKTAPLAIILLGNTARMRFQQFWEQDMGAAAENLLLEAVQLQLGAVWLGVHPLSERAAAIKRQFVLPDELKPFAVISIGYPRDADANRFVERYDAARVHYEAL